MTPDSDPATDPHDRADPPPDRTAPDAQGQRPRSEHAHEPPHVESTDLDRHAGAPEDADRQRDDGAPPLADHGRSPEAGPEAPNDATGHVPDRHANTLIFPASLDPDAVSVVRRLHDAGFESYLVGGCVRDLLSGKIPKDFDVSTQARPRQIRSRFRNCRVIGRRFKLAHVHFREKIIEVATFRRTPEDDGGSPPEDLLIVRDNEYGTAEEDVLRRDFTMNALLYDVTTEEVIDWVGGFDDVNNKVLRTIGDAQVRLAEDPVRMLRAVKFMSRLGLTLDDELDAAMRSCAHLIDKSAPPRVLEEIYKILTCGRASEALTTLVEYGLLEHLLPEVGGYWNDHREQIAATGAALDRIDHGARRVSNAFLLSALFLDPWRDRDEDLDAMPAIQDMVGSAARRMSIPRRDVAGMKQLLMLQPRLERNRRSRRVPLAEFLGRPSSQEAIDLLYLAALSGRVDPEIHARWAERLAQTHPQLTPSEDSEEEQDQPRSRRRRSRGGRRRRRRSSESRDEFLDEQLDEQADEGVAASADGGTQTPRPEDGTRSDTTPGDGSGRRPRRRRGSRGGRSARAEGATGQAPVDPAPERTPVEPAPPQPAAEKAAAPAPKGLGRMFKSLVAKVLGRPDVEAAPSDPAMRPSEAARSEPRDAEQPAAGESRVEADDRERQDEGDATKPRRRRRRRSRRRSGSGSEGEDREEGGSEKGDAEPRKAEDGEQSSSGRSRRRGGSRSKSGSRSKGGSRSGGGGSSSKSGSGGKSGSRSQSRRGGKSSTRKDSGRNSSKPPKKESEEDPAKKRLVHEHPEDIEDLFDW